MKARILSRSSFLIPALFAAVFMAIPNTAHAAAANGGQPLPWEGPLNQVLASFTGPVAKALCILSIVLIGFGFAFSEGGGMAGANIGCQGVEEAVEPRFAAVQSSLLVLFRNSGRVIEKRLHHQPDHFLQHLLVKGASAVNPLHQGKHPLHRDKHPRLGVLRVVDQDGARRASAITREGVTPDSPARTLAALSTSSSIHNVNLTFCMARSVSCLRAATRQ